MQITLKGNPVNTKGDLPQVGLNLPNFSLVKRDLSEVSLENFTAPNIVLNIFPSLDTGTCAASVRRFNKEAATLGNTDILCISSDLPFAQQRFCIAEDIDKAIPLSAYRSSFGDDYNVKLTNGPLKGLLARAVLVANSSRKIIHCQLVSEITEEPNYTVVLESLS